VLVDDVQRLSWRPSLVESNWKSIAQTWFGWTARSRWESSVRLRRRFLVRTGRRSPSSRQSRWIRLWFTLVQGFVVSRRSSR